MATFAVAPSIGGQVLADVSDEVVTAAILDEVDGEIEGGEFAGTGDELAVANEQHVDDVET
ncbi:hypothetical protein [Mesorhizobium australicum]|uniref:hypothetical protein n=1 Tax=Mesorhizobium australicum TaxID=536018 RepID=UPI0033394521